MRLSKEAPGLAQITVFIYSNLPASQTESMIRISTNLHEIEIVEAVSALGRGKVKDLIWLLAKYTNDEQFLEECAEMFRREVARNAQVKRRGT